MGLRAIKEHLSHLLNAVQSAKAVKVLELRLRPVDRLKPIPAVLALLNVEVLQGYDGIFALLQMATQQVDDGR